MAYEDMCELMTGYPLSRVVVIDTETTGVNEHVDEVLSVGITDGYGRRLFYSLVRPTEHETWPGAQAVNGISPAMVRFAPTFKRVARKIRGAIGDGKLIVGYNTGFDLAILERQGLFDCGFRPAATFDVMNEYALVHGTRMYDSKRYKWSKLSQCAAHYGHTFRAHNALQDARATAHCFRSLLCDKDYIRKKTESDARAKREIRLSQTPKTRDAMAALLPSGITAKVNAVLMLGSIAKGKNAGKPRYKCMTDGRCIGVTSPSAIDGVRLFYHLRDDDPLPASVPVTVDIAFADGPPCCSATISGKSWFDREVEKLAAAMRAATPAAAKGTGRAAWTALTVGGRSHAEPSRGRKRRFVPWLAAGALLVLVALGSIADVSSGEVAPETVAVEFIVGVTCILVGTRRAERDKQRKGGGRAVRHRPKDE